jgi:Domain of unknown function (DUF4180)
MDIKIHNTASGNVAEITSPGLAIASVSDGTDLVGNLYFQGIDKAVIYQDTLLPEFFDLTTGIAGEILQKCSTYRILLAIVGNFSHYQSRSLANFIFESNKGRQVSFVGSLQEALDKFNS